MTKTSDFDSIRPFNDNEVVGIIEKLCQEPYFLRILTVLYPMVPTPQLVAKLKQITTVDEFQDNSICHSSSAYKTPPKALVLRIENLTTHSTFLYEYRDIKLDSHSSTQTSRAERDHRCHWLQSAYLRLDYRPCKTQ